MYVTMSLERMPCKLCDRWRLAEREPEAEKKRFMNFHMQLLHGEYTWASKITNLLTASENWESNALNSIRTFKVTYQVRNTFNRPDSPCQMLLRLPEICFALVNIIIKYSTQFRRQLSATVFVTWESRVGNLIILTVISVDTCKKKKYHLIFVNLGWNYFERKLFCVRSNILIFCVSAIQIFTNCTKNMETSWEIVY